MRTLAPATEINEAAATLRGADPAAVVEVGRRALRRARRRRVELLRRGLRRHRPRAQGRREAGGTARVFALDTGRLHDETYLTAERVRMKYDLEIQWMFPQREAVEQLIRVKGLYSFRDSLDNRHECCGIRKVEPLGRALAELDAWFTGLRREQSVTRTEGAEVEIDAAHGGMTKVNPLIGWTMEQVRAYAKANAVPVHPLHDKGFPSIGCAPCTRAIQPGEHPRAGRWWWEDPENKECGIHLPTG